MHPTHPIYHPTCILLILYTILHASYSSYIPSYIVLASYSFHITPSMYLTHFKYPPSCILLIDPIYHLTCILFILYTILHASYSSYIPSYMHPIHPIYHPICILFILYTILYASYSFHISHPFISLISNIPFMYLTHRS